MESDQQREEKEKGKQPQNNEQAQEECKEEEEKKAGDGFGGNLDVNINIRREKQNLDGANERAISGNAQTKDYLDSLLRRNEVNFQESLEKAVGDYIAQNRQYPDANYNTMMGFVTQWLGLIDFPRRDLESLMHRVRALREKDHDDDDVEIGQIQQSETIEEEYKEVEENKKQVDAAQQEHHEEEVGSEFGGYLGINIQTVVENLDRAIEVRDVDIQIYLDHVRRGIDIDAQIQLLRAIGGYYERNGRYPYSDEETLQGFITNELQLADIAPEVFFHERIETLQSTHRRLRTIVNAKGASCLVDPEVLMVRLGDKTLWGIESSDLPLNSEFGDAFGGNLDGAEDAKDDEEEEGREINQVGDGFGGNLNGANQDARDDLEEDFRDDPNFSIDVEEFLMNWRDEGTRREM